MATRKPKPIEVHPISVNPNATHKPEDVEPGADGYARAWDFASEEQPFEQTLEEARAEEETDDDTAGNDDTDTAASTTPKRIKLKWTDEMKHAVLTGINDYLQSAGALPSILDLFEVVQSDPAFAHLDGRLNHKGEPVFTPASLQVGVNAIRKTVASAIANGAQDVAPLPRLAKVQTTRTPRVSNAVALGKMIASLPALRALREAEMAEIANGIGQSNEDSTGS